MRLAKIICIILAVALVVCLPLTAYAKPPRRVLLMGAIYGGDGSITSRSLLIDPISNNIFGLSSPVDLELCTRIYFYFRTDVEDVRTFSVSIKLLSTQLQINQGGTNIPYMRMLNISESGTFSDITTIANNSCTISYDGNTTTWDYASTSVTGRNSMCLCMTFNNFMLGSSPIYFEVTNFLVNGMSVEEVEVEQYSQQFQERLERLEDIEDRAYQQGQDIPINDIQDYLSRTDGDHYFSAFHYLFAQSTLLSTMVTVVCLFGIIGFIIYGKKV